MAATRALALDGLTEVLPTWATTQHNNLLA